MLTQTTQIFSSQNFPDVVVSWAVMIHNNIVMIQDTEMLKITKKWNKIFKKYIKDVRSTTQAYNHSILQYRQFYPTKTILWKVYSTTTNDNLILNSWQSKFPCPIRFKHTLQLGVVSTEVREPNSDVVDRAKYCTSMTPSFDWRRQHGDNTAAAAAAAARAL